MKDQAVGLGPRERLGPREQQMVELLLLGCDNAEIAAQLKMALRTVKAHFNRLFLRFGITGLGNQASETRYLVVQEASMSEIGRYGNRVPSEREYRVIELVAEGLKNKEVAEAIGTTEHVVKNYLRVIYDKLGLWNRVELALWFESRRDASVMLIQ